MTKNQEWTVVRGIAAQVCAGEGGGSVCAGGPDLGGLVGGGCLFVHADADTGGRGLVCWGGCMRFVCVHPSSQPYTQPPPSVPPLFTPTAVTTGPDPAAEALVAASPSCPTDPHDNSPPPGPDPAPAGEGDGD